MTRVTSAGRTVVLAGLIAQVAPGPAQAREASPKSKKEATMTKPADDIRDFVFTFRSLEDHRGGELFGTMDVTRVDVSTGRALVLANRQSEDAPGPAGLFSTTLRPGQVDALVKILDGIKWGRLPDPEGGDIMVPQLQVDYTRGKQIVQRAFNVMSRGPFMRAVEPLVDLVGELEGEIQKYPVRAVNATLEKTATGVKMTIANVGTGTVIINDGRWVGQRPARTRAGFSVAYREPGYKPSSFGSPPKPQPLAVKTDGKEHPPITLAPGQVHELESVPFAPTKPGRYRVTGGWEDYEGPAVDPKTILPLIPEPKDLDDARPYVLLGAAFTRELVYDVEPPRR